MSISDFQISKLKEPVHNGLTRSELWRRTQLKQIKRIIEENEITILKALNEDLGKPETEAFFELIALHQELNHAEKNLKNWMKPQKVQVPISLQPSHAFIRPQPLGCVLIIGPWNYPFSLVFQPLINALSAGNTAVLKPSEHAPSTSQLIKKLIEKYFSSKVVRVFEGDSAIAKSLLKEPFDHIFFTGGSQIGKEIMKAASNNLTPVTLELGGKSPAIILRDTDIKVTARRLTWGKALNSGQTCIAPDHLLIQKDIYNSLLQEIKSSIKTFYGDNPSKSNNIAKIVNEHHFNRLRMLIEDARENQEIVIGGEVNKEQRKISPTFVRIKDISSPLMDEEIFGPIMPIILIDSLEHGLKILRKNPHPLAIYLFGGTKSEQRELIETSISGGVCINDVVMQAGISALPFGGVGTSGMGKYHGLEGFNTFSHRKSILKRSFWPDIKFRYPPYKLNISYLKGLLR